MVFSLRYRTQRFGLQRFSIRAFSYTAAMLTQRCASRQWCKSMENISDRTNATGQRGDSLAMSDISDDIIDVSAIDFSDNDTWLQPPSLDAARNSIGDSGSWTRTDADRDSDISQDNRKAVDTRTFTRPKKRTGRLSFEFETSRPRSPNVWNRASHNSRRDSEDEASRLGSDSIPHMLRPSGAVSSLVSGSLANPGHESLEAFLNMSRSKGIDSFIDLAEPEFTDDLMDVSQPSMLYSSVLSVATEDTSQISNCSLPINQSFNVSRHSGIEDSQILTESMMQTSMFGDVVDVNFNDTFAKNSANVTVVENEDYHESMDATFLALGDTKEPLINGTFNAATLNGGVARTMDETYTPSKVNATLTNDPHASYIVNRSPCLSSELLRASAINDASYVLAEVVDRTSLAAFSDVARDASFVVTSELPSARENATIVVSKSPKVLDRNDTFNIRAFDATFETAPPSENHALTERCGDVQANAEESSQDGTLEEPSATLLKASRPDDTLRSSSEDTVQALSPCEKSAQSPSPSEIFEADEKISEAPARVDEAGRPNVRDSTFEAPVTRIGKASRPLSRLNVPRSVTSGETLPSLKKPAAHPTAPQPNETFELRNFDATFENSAPSVPKKSSTIVKPASTISSTNETFKAPSSDIARQRNVEASSHGGSLDNLGTTFEKAPSKIANPRHQLSRLPQSFQKSNPNLGSSALKYATTTTTTTTNNRSAIPSFGYNRARPGLTRNNDGLHFTSKLLVLGKVKSGSEQRLDVTRNVAEIQLSGGGGSTESIDSTQSAHSAPDFDDRLSVRSDGSNASYGMRSMNIEEFQKIVRMREECLKQESTPKPGRRVLENNWVTTANDLPSPILKNGPETYGSRGSSPRSTDSTVKTSSPLLSPSESLQNLPLDAVESNKNNIDGNKLTLPRPKSIVAKKITQVSMKPPQKSTTGEHRTGLRPPASWTSTNRPASGIPRPASRIPGPRFARPNTKINQGDTRK